MLDQDVQQVVVYRDDSARAARRFRFTYRDGAL
jgi:hypothetical protein